MRNCLSALAWTACCWASATPARGAIVEGTVVDASVPGVPMGFITVEIRRDADDGLIETLLTDSLGFYRSTTIPDHTPVYVIARWERPLVPAPMYNNKVIRVLDLLPGPAVTFTPKASLSENPGTGTAIIDIAMDQPQPAGLTQLFNEIQLTLDYVNNHKGAVAWEVTYDVPVHLRSDAAAFFEPTTQSMHIELTSIDGTGTAFDRVTLYHELAHMIHHYTHNTAASAAAGCACHSVRTEEDVVCAFQEAWASYIGQLVAEFGGVSSFFYTLYRDPGNINWRGGGSSGCGWDDNTVAGLDPWTPTGYDGCPADCRFESGEVVEGAVGGALFGWHDDPSITFEDIFGAFVAHTPDNISEMADAMHSRLTTAHPSYHQIDHQLQTHGIVYTRARFQTTPLDPVAVPSTPAQDMGGSTLEIAGMTFIRGQATARFEAVPAVDLAVQVGLPPLEVRLLYVTADDNTATPGFTPYVLASTGMLTFDTSGWGDGDCDLVLIGKTALGDGDSLLPSWTGDGNPLTDTAEKALKYMGTWYDKDRDPTTPPGDPGREGKVIIDNTAPRATGFTIGP